MYANLASGENAASTGEPRTTEDLFGILIPKLARSTLSSIVATKLLCRSNTLMLCRYIMFCAKNNPAPECTMLFGCKLSLAMVSTSERIRSSDRLPSEGTSVVAVVVVLVFGVEVVGAVVPADVSAGAFDDSPFAQAASPRTMLMLMIKRFTPARL